MKEEKSKDSNDSSNLIVGLYSDLTMETHYNADSKFSTLAEGKDTDAKAKEVREVLQSIMAFTYKVTKNVFREILAYKDASTIIEVLLPYCAILFN